MVKSIMGLLIGIAIAEGAIKSVDDLPEAYVPASGELSMAGPDTAICYTCRQASFWRNQR